jgi:LytS/YehU family sensor histidine kinase
MNMLLLAFEPPRGAHHEAERSVRVLDSIVFCALNVLSLFCSLWANLRWREHSLGWRIGANVALYLALCGGAIVLHYPVWQMLHSPSLSFFIRDEFMRELTMLGLSVTVAWVMDVSAQNQRMKHQIAEIQRESLVGQIESLKQHIHPHFFFNSLNTLSGLAKEDADKTIEFIEKLSLVFRSVLEIQQKNLVTLAKELEFADAYMYLMQVRFAGKLLYSVDMAEWGAMTDMYLIPPLSSQLLLENVVKHNRMTRNEPIHVQVCMEQSDEGVFFVVENNRNPQHNVISTGTGLPNLAARCRLLMNKELSMNKTEHHFIVRVPLVRARELSPFTRNGDGATV